MESFFLSETCKYLYLVGVCAVHPGNTWRHLEPEAPQSSI